VQDNCRVQCQDCLPLSVALFSSVTNHVAVDSAGINTFEKYSVSQKNIPDIFSCNFEKHCRIFIMFGTYVTEKVTNQ